MFNTIATFHEPVALTAAEKEQQNFETTELSNGHAENNNNEEKPTEPYKYIQVQF